MNNNNIQHITDNNFLTRRMAQEEIKRVGGIRNMCQVVHVQHEDEKDEKR